MIKCKNCKKEIDNPKWNQIYCNVECRTKDYDNKNQLIKKHHPCEICGFWRFTESHHIIKQMDFGSDTSNNLIKLCPNHHKMADSYRYGEEFLKLIKKKTGKVGEKLSKDEIKKVKNFIMNKLNKKNRKIKYTEDSWAFHFEMRQLINYGEFYKIALIK